MRIIAKCAAVEGDIAVEQREVGVERDRLVGKVTGNRDDRTGMGVGIKDAGAESAETHCISRSRDDVGMERHR
jgi:hypothetical protein